MNYKKIVDIIRSLTGLYKVEVIYNDKEAELRYGGAYAGFSGCEDYVVEPDNEMLTSGFLDFEDFLEQEHIKYYHVGLPKDIYASTFNEERRPVFEKLFSSINVTLSVMSVEVFTILHEFGHAHELYVKCNEDLLQYVREGRERKSEIFHMDFEGYSDEKKMYMYREIPSEKYADNFAKQYLRQVLEIAGKDGLSW